MQTTDGYAYTYDRDGNPTSKANLTHHALDEVYSYDGLNRLTGVTRGGTITGTGSTVTMTGTATFSQSYAMDALGNIVAQTTTASGTTTIEQRGYDRQNEFTATTTLVSGTVTAAGSFAYDLDGNQTYDASTGNTYAYDAWNHLAKATVPGNTTVTYTSDALGRLVTQTSVTGTNAAEGTATYYNGNWQDVEERAITSGTVAATASLQNVWSTTYIDALIERDRDADDDAGTGGDNARDVSGSFTGGLEERLYATHDANFNTTGLLQPGTSTGTGTTVERYSYMPYGTPTFYDGSWTVLVTQTSAYGNRRLFQGLRLEATTGLLYARRRWYGSDQERWTQNDRNGWPEGSNRYIRTSANPESHLDWMGTQANDWPDGGYSSFDEDPYVIDARKRIERHQFQIGTLQLLIDVLEAQLNRIPPSPPSFDDSDDWVSNHNPPSENSGKRTAILNKQIEHGIEILREQRAINDIESTLELYWLFYYEFDDGIRPLQPDRLDQDNPR